jgi:hypothetical protein
LQTRNCAEVRISPKGSTSVADEEGRNDVDVETPGPEGDKPQSKKPLGKRSKAAKRGKKKKSLNIKENRIEENQIEEDRHKMHDRITTPSHGKI